MFYFSFLVREQKVALEVDDNPESPWEGDMIACELLLADLSGSFTRDECAADTNARDPSLDCVDPAQAAATLKTAEISKHQVVLELTQEVWKVSNPASQVRISCCPRADFTITDGQQTQEAIEAYDIDEPMIPMREDFVPATANGKKKWG